MKTRRLILLGALALFAGAPLLDAQSRKKALGAYVDQFKGDWVTAKHGELPYFMYAPRTVSTRKLLPLVVTLHGSAEVGGKGPLLTKIPGVASFSYYNKERPCIVIAPQCPAGTSWMAAGGDQVLALLDDLLKEVQVIDKKRIYITGYSLGGYGTYHLVAKRPELFAAAVPVAGAGHPSMAAKMKGVAVCIYHGKNDPNVPFDRATQMEEALKEAGVPVRVEALGAGHGIQKKAYWPEDLHEWMFKQKRD